MSSDSVEAPDGSRKWRSYASETFVLHFPPDSSPERDSALIASRLEDFRRAFASALEIDTSPAGSIHVYLSDVETEGGLDADTPIDSADQASETGRLQAVYRSDAPGQGLERELATLLVSAPLGERASEWPMFVDGLVGYVGLHSGKLDSVKLRSRLAELVEQGRDLSLEEFSKGPGPEKRALHNQVATSFVAFLIATHGTERLKEFASKIDSANPSGAAEASYGKSMVDLQADWLSNVKRKPQVMGVGRLLRLTVGWLRPYWRIELVVLATMLVSLAFTIILPLSFRFLIDRAILPGDRQMLAVIMAVLTGLFALNVVASLIKGYVTARLGANVMNDMRLALFTHLQRLSAGFYAQAKVGDVLSRLSTDLSPIQNVMTNVLPTAIQLGLSVAISGVLLFVLEWRLALLTLVAIPVLGISTRIFGPRAARASYKRQQGLADVATDVQENIGAQTVVRAFGLQDREIERFKARIEELGQTIVRMAFLSSLMTVMATLTGFLVQMLVVGVGAFMVLNGDLTLGSLIAFLGLLGNVLAPLLGATDLVRSVQYATGGMQRVEELLGEDVEVVDAPDARPLPGPTTEIRVDDLSFSYTGEQLNLNEVSLKVGMGDHVAFVGPSGCGKSTMLSLFMRFYDPTAGSITVDGHDLRNVSQASLRGHIGAVLQENIFFNISVRENIRLGRLDATDEEIETAAKAAEVHDDILGFPQGYDTVVGERGGRLSGGQRQRMAIARAVLRDPSVLLLDEATSALDPPTEAAVNATLERLSQGRTVLSVTHRLSSVVEADRIFVFDKGRLVDQGEHRELVDREGVYRDL